MSVSRTTELLESKYVAPANQATTNTYADVVGSKIDTYSQKLVSYICVNAHVANSIDWKVLGSNDDTSYVEVQAEATLAAAAIGSYTSTAAPYRYYKIQVKATVGNSQGTADVSGMAKH